MSSAHTLVGLTALTLLVHAAWTDVQTRLIRNSTSALLLLCYAVAVLTSPTPVAILSGLGMATLTFCFGFVLWRLGFLGGGDVKLLSVLALWAGFAHGLDLLLITALAGGVLVVVQSAMSGQHRWARRWLPALASAEPKADASMHFPTMRGAGATRCGEHEEPATGSAGQLPYGVAIACGGAWVLFNQFGA